MTLTMEQVAAACGARVDRAQLWAPYLSQAMTAYDITTPERAAAFLAQVGHESMGLRYTTELWGPTTTQAGYERRADLGNNQQGDGYRYRGRGLIQTTGRSNYRVLRDRLRESLDVEVPDFEANPDTVAEFQWAALSAADYWDMRGLNALADSGDFERISARVNGRNKATGMPHGWEDRLARYERAMQVLA